MRNTAKLLVILLVFGACFGIFAACEPKPDHEHTWVNGVCTQCDAEYELVDYVSQLKLDENSSTEKTAPGGAELVRMYIDGDTTHFNVPVTDKHPEGVLKARYLAVNTPESTGQVEPYGKVASNFTKKTLQDAIANGGKVLVESDSDEWENDSYGRTTAWVWYQPEANADWRNLNLELLQKGLGFGSSVSENRYGETCLAAVEQAMRAKLIVHSGVKDENYYYGQAQEITIKELRTNFEEYELVKVAFDGYVTASYDGTSYVQQYDEEDGIWYGISVFYNGSGSDIKKALAVGSHVRVVGTAQDFNGTWQVSGLSYNIINTKDPANTFKLDDEIHDIDPVVLTIAQFNANRTVDVIDHTAESDEIVYVPKTYPLHTLLVGTRVKMVDLIVDHTYTTPSGTSKDAFTLYCKDSSGNEITVRTEVLNKWNEETQRYELVTADEFECKTITVIGIVDWYNYDNHNEYQLRVVDYNDLIQA